MMTTFGDYRHVFCRLSIVICLVFVLGCHQPETSAVLADTQAISGPLLKTTPVIDLGKISSYTRTELELAVSNGGDEDLLIDKVEPGCGCTVTELTEDLRTIMPGSEVRIPITVLPYEQTGERRVDIAIEWNSAKLSPSRVSLVYEIENKFELSSHIVGLEMGSTDELLSTNIQITSADDSPFQVEQIVTPDYVSSEIYPRNDKGSSFELIFKLTDQIPDGFHSDEVYLDIDKPEAQRLVLVGRFNSRERLFSDTSIVYLEDLNIGEPENFNVTVSRLDMRPFSLNQVLSPSGQVNAEYPAGEHDSINVDFTLVLNDKGSFSEEIQLVGDPAQNESVTIQVLANGI